MLIGGECKTTGEDSDKSYTQICATARLLEGKIEVEKEEGSFCVVALLLGRIAGGFKAVLGTRMFGQK
jgi:hypothetical protein